MEVALASVVCAGLGYATRRRRRRERILGGFVLCVLLFSLRLNSNSVAKYLSSNIPQERVFLLAGQSNMAGRGGLVKKNNQVKKVFDPLMLQHQFERDLVVADGRVERLTADMRWIPAIEPMHVDIDFTKSCGIGPGLMFARMIGGTSRLIPCAVGGTKMDEWAQDSHLYQTMLTRARFANAPIDALVWYQGESDGMLSVDADGFLDKLVDLTTRIRRDLNQPDLLILVVNIWASLERCPLRDDIRYAIAQLPFLVRNVYVVDAQHSTLLDDNIHLTSQSQHRIAALLARTFITTQ